MAGPSAQGEQRKFAFLVGRCGALGRFEMREHGRVLRRLPDRLLRCEFAQPLPRQPAREFQEPVRSAAEVHPAWRLVECVARLLWNRIKVRAPPHALKPGREVTVHLGARRRCARRSLLPQLLERLEAGRDENVEAEDAQRRGARRPEPLTDLDCECSPPVIALRIVGEPIVERLPPIGAGRGRRPRQGAGGCNARAAVRARGYGFPAQ